MTVSKILYLLLKVFILSGLALKLASCVMVEERIDQITGGPNLPEHTALAMQSDSIDEHGEKALRSVLPGPLKITMTEAVLLCLENNRALVVERLNPSIQKTFEDTEKAVFDPETNAIFSAGRVDGERLARSGSETESFTTDEADGAISLKQFFPTGTTVSLEGGTQIDDSSLYQDSFYWTRLGLSVNQAILRGYGTDVNLVRLRQARLDTRMSEYELRGFAQSLVAQVEQTYWDYAVARRHVEIFEESLKVAVSNSAKPMS